MIPPPFVIFALPRSRTAWLSRFLTYGEWQCGHDELRHCRSLDDVRSWFAQPNVGSVETAGAPFWRLLRRFVPDVRVVTVRRPVSDVAASLIATGVAFDAAVLQRTLRHLDRKLDQIERRVPSVLRIDFADLALERSCAWLFEHCLPYRHDHTWWQSRAPVNVQINLPQLMRYYVAHKPQLDKLAKTAKHRIMADMRGAPGAFDGMTFQREPFHEFYRDAQPLFAEHLVQTEQSPDDHERKNLPLLQALDDLGMLEITTARSNGRMFGYLMTVVGPSLDSPDVLQGLQTLFFASPDVQGLGMQLQRAALEALRGRGIDEVLFRAGHRGSGPRLGTFFRRLGAEEFGQLYRLGLG